MYLVVRYFHGIKCDVTLYSWSLGGTKSRCPMYCIRRDGKGDHEKTYLENMFERIRSFLPSIDQVFMPFLHPSRTYAKVLGVRSRSGIVLDLDQWAYQGVAGLQSLAQEVEDQFDRRVAVVI